MSHCCEDDRSHESHRSQRLQLGNPSAQGEALLQRKPKDLARSWLILASLLLFYLLTTQVFVIDISFNPRFIRPKNPATSSATNAEPNTNSVDTSALTEKVLPAQGITLPVKWGSLGRQLLEEGVIDEGKFRQLFNKSLNEQEEALLTGNFDQPIVLNNQNSRFLLDLLWAFGLSNKNEILEKGEMTDEKYGGAGNFASTGGWSLAKGDAMDHYSRYEFVKLTSEQQGLVDEVSRGIYRPCCGNSTHFPDCNHGMAMLGLLELMAASGVGKDEMYQVALKVNSFWFPQTYLDLATYFKEQGVEWDAVNAAEVLGSQFSSGQGYQTTRQKIQSLPKPASGGGGCGA